MFNITIFSEYVSLYNKFIEQEGLCLIFLFAGFGILFVFLGGFIFSKNKDDWFFKYFCIFCVIIGVFIEIISFCIMLKIESNIGKLNNEWYQYQAMLEEQEEIKNE